MKIKISNTQLAIVSIILAIPAFLINLGMFGFTGDECIRTLVAFEMHESGNYIATTMHGADYINKPPLWLSNRTGQPNQAFYNKILKKNKN